MKHLLGDHALRIQHCATPEHATIIIVRVLWPSSPYPYSSEEAQPNHLKVMPDEQSCLAACCIIASVFFFFASLYDWVSSAYVHRTCRLLQSIPSSP